jgi:hypothetical protein
MSRIVGSIKWFAFQFAAIAAVAIATNLLESAGALPSHSVAITPPKLITVVDRSGKADRLIRRAPSVNIVLPRGCESSVSMTTNLSRSDLGGA